MGLDEIGSERVGWDVMGRIGARRAVSAGLGRVRCSEAERGEFDMHARKDTYCLTRR